MSEGELIKFKWLATSAFRRGDDILFCPGEIRLVERHERSMVQHILFSLRYFSTQVATLSSSSYDFPGYSSGCKAASWYQNHCVCASSYWHPPIFGDINSYLRT
jgi:hypothetical protein